ncbi:MAG: hypothetical protein ING08_19100 [Roseomonas sp.]|nr:hypothetical protein [Roseomonas sp.]MCA3382337.1 hypothetical protein [Roseomonas sp.]
MTLSAQSFSAQSIWDYVDGKKRAAEAAERAEAATRRAEQEKLREAFEARDVAPDALDRIATLVRRAVDAGEKEALVMRFPSEWLPDQGRSITSHDPAWRERLSGFPKRAYDFFERELAPRGFQIKVQILDWPGGMPGDVGWFITWKRPEED